MLNVRQHLTKGALCCSFPKFNNAVVVGAGINVAKVFCMCRRRNSINSVKGGIVVPIRKYDVHPGLRVVVRPRPHEDPPLLITVDVGERLVEAGCVLEHKSVGWSRLFDDKLEFWL